MELQSCELGPAAMWRPWWLQSPRRKDPQLWCWGTHPSRKPLGKPPAPGAMGSLGTAEGGAAYHLGEADPAATALPAGVLI